MSERLSESAVHDSAMVKGKESEATSSKVAETDRNIGDVRNKKKADNDENAGDRNKFKVEMPMFNGEDPDSWLFCTERTVTLRSSNAGEVRKKGSSKRLPDAEFKARKEKGLCFRCNEKYSADHKWVTMVDWENLSLTFTGNGKQICIKGDPSLTKACISLKILDQYADVFEWLDKLPPRRDIEHHIHLKKGVIRPSTSPVLLVKKKDDSWCFCVDYRAVNNSTILDKFPILVVEELFDELCGASLYSKIDLKPGYHRIRMVDEDIEKTAFRTHEGHYEFLITPFGLTNAPATFQALTNAIFKPHLRMFVLLIGRNLLTSGKSGDSLGVCKWNEEAEEAFDRLKKAMMSLPVLALPNFDHPFEIETDALGYGVGAVLVQSKRPIAFYSHTLAMKDRARSIYERELMAVVLAVQRWRPSYLLGTKFLVKTDHKLLKFLLEQRVIYKPGLENKVADALSRKPPDVQFCSISVPVLIDLKIIKEEMENDLKFQVPLEIPLQIWTMDFVDGLPKAKGYEVILVVVDRLSKYGHFLPLKHPYTAKLRERDIVLVALREHIFLAQEQMKKYADGKRRDVEYQIGPIRSLEKIGSMAYKLELPENTSIHPVFHVSQLKKLMGEHSNVQPTIQYVNENFEWKAQLEEILGYQKNKARCWEVMLCWEGLPGDETTWKVMRICNDFTLIFTLGQGEFREGE
ncbi:reverse transcriptase [Cucumis melo var. makuwa]|uniref:Reverse transcriptase n=1 Tax=Cucumis melo var. makuwa TaxID=1194695 RepID=A0A5D3CBB3_CUCMM|nr:reverse transcriptase [Cucumis melo var. makuwa]TYK08630.1 reverse transcriptase [Cucumis melo var. makuwa]